MNHFKPKNTRAHLDQITHPFRLDAARLKSTLTSQGVNEPVSVLYRYPAPGRVECTVRIGSHFDDSGYWFVGVVL